MSSKLLQNTRDIRKLTNLSLCAYHLRNIPSEWKPLCPIYLNNSHSQSYQICLFVLGDLLSYLGFDTFIEKFYCQGHHVRLWSMSPSMEEKDKAVRRCCNRIEACLNLVTCSLEFCFHVQIPAGMELASLHLVFTIGTSPCPLPGQANTSSPTQPLPLQCSCAHAGLRWSDS